ncbi:MAG: metallophosphoesterase [Anaerolineales bacterium]|nr:metallophosphoesterase [Anaerolineales bacterium]
MSDRPRPVSRRAFLRAARNLLAAGVLSTSSAVWYVWRIEPAWLSVERFTLRLPRLPHSWDGVILSQLSDLHFGPVIEPDYIHSAIDLTLGLRPDFIVITGDFVSSLQHSEADEVERALRRLSAPYGVFACLGNHDWWTNAAVVAEAVRRSGVTLLRNEHVALGENFYLAGVEKNPQMSQMATDFLYENKFRHQPATVSTPTFVPVRSLRAYSCPLVRVNSLPFVPIRNNSCQFVVESATVRPTKSI